MKKRPSYSHQERAAKRMAAIPRTAGILLPQSKGDWRVILDAAGLPQHPVPAEL